MKSKEISLGKVSLFSFSHMEGYEKLGVDAEVYPQGVFISVSLWTFTFGVSIGASIGD